jgi:hypothetical protein
MGVAMPIDPEGYRNQSGRRWKSIARGIEIHTVGYGLSWRGVSSSMTDAMERGA